MNIINWTDFNGDKFQFFCNDLLSFEFGKNFVPFTAPGADQGIDGFFDGEYNGKKGKWRFQAKFHSPETGRIAGFNQLKNQIKQDISKNIQNETTVVFITNVELNPKQRKELKEIAVGILRESYRLVEFHIWDGAKINTLLAHHPIVKLWYTNQTKFLIQEYSEFFREELNKRTNTSYELSNKFYHRKDKLETLDKYIQDDNKNIAVVSGEPGIGKTRLCIEFFKKYIDENDEWVALVIITHRINLEVLQIALSGEKNYIVLIDDADKFNESDIADLYTLIKGIKQNKVKLLLTVRSYFLNQVLSQITVNEKTEQVDLIQLNQLTREETVQFLEDELKGYNIAEYLGSFVELTHGVPIMIMTLLKVIKNGTKLSEIKKDSFLNTYVKQYFEQFESSTSEDKEILKKNIVKVINLIALIEPVQFEDKNIIRRIASTENLSEEDVEVILQKMKEQNIVSGQYQSDIKPDIYSDIILEEALKSKSWLENKLPEYATHINNIIKNIGYTSHNKEDNAILETLLKGYIKRIEDCNDDREITKILDAVYSITFEMPLLASEAVEKVLLIFTNESHPLYGEFRQSLIYKNYSLNSTIKNLKNILRSLFQLDDYYTQAFVFSGKLYNILNDEGIVSNIAVFNKTDRFEGFICKRQNQILTVSKTELKKANGNMKLFALKALKSILKLEFTDTESHLFQKYSIQIYTIYIPENEYIKKLRKEAINLLIDVFWNEPNIYLKEEILKIIIDVPREIFAARNKNYKGKAEIKTVLNSLITISSKGIFELKQKQFIKDQLYWFKRWGIDNSYYTKIDKINDNLTGNDLAEKLLEVFNPKYDENINDEKEKYEVESQKLIISNSVTDLGNALVKVIEQSEYPPINYYQFLETVTSDLVKAKELINHLWKTNKAFVINHCSNVLRQLRFSKSDEDFYWIYVEKFQKENSIEERNSILHVYNSFSIHDTILKLGNKSLLKEEDYKLITTIFQTSTPENYFNLAFTLPTLFYYDKMLALKEIEQFLQNCNDRHFERLLIAFNPIEEENYLEIKKLLFENTLHLNISYSVEKFLNKVIIKDGFHEVLIYIENRFLFNRKYVIEKKSFLGYEYIPTHNGNNITSGLSDIQKEQIFSDVLNWFVDFNFESYEHFYAKNIIELFAVQKYIDQAAKTTYIELIEKNNSNYNKLINIIQSTSEFEQKNEAFVDLIITLLEVGYNNIDDEKQLKEFTTQCYISLTALGVKTGTPGQPFSVDLQLKELIENTLKSSKLKTLKIRDFFQRALKSVQSNIDRDSFDEGGELW